MDNTVDETAVHTAFDTLVNGVNRIDSPARALVVVDPAEAQKSLGDRLAAAGFEITYARDGLEAFNAFVGRRVDLIVTDWQMPGLNGIGLVRRIRKISNVPVVMITAFGSIPDCEEAMRVGVDRYLQFGRDLDRVGEIARELMRHPRAGPPTPKRMNGSPERNFQASEVRSRRFDLARMTASEARLLARRELREELQRHLFECRGNVAEMARRMGKDRSTIRYHLRRLELLRPATGDHDPAFPACDRRRAGD